jgi:hypothetical protein
VRRSFLTAAAALAAATAVVVPAGPAGSAPGNSLRIVTLDRHGVPLSNTATVTNSRTSRVYQLATNQTHPLPAGTYVVLVDIYGAPDFTDTLGARRVTVSGPSQVTFRARFGRPVRAWLRPMLPGGYSQRLAFDLSDTTSYGAISGGSARGDLFVLPSAVRSVDFAYSAFWEPADAAGDRYLGAAVHRHGIPDGVSRTFRRSALTTVEVSARRGPEAGHPDIELRSDPANLALGDVMQLITRVTLPTSFTSHVTPGRWQVWEDGRDFLVSRDHSYLAGHRYHVRINRAVWGPTAQLPYRWTGGRFYVVTNWMFTDPALTEYGPGYNLGIRLMHHGRLILSRTVRGEGATVNPILRDAGWYTLTESAKRLRTSLFPGVLSPRAAVVFHYYDDLTNYRQMRGYVTQFLPIGLNTRNEATAGSHTRVTLRLRRDKADDGVRQPADAVSAVSVWWSGNAGISWHRLPAVRRNGVWTMTVPNPASGTVSLRATVHDTHGDWTRTTVIDGYAVG